MDSFQLNKYLMAILGTIFIVMSLNFLSGAIYFPHASEEKGFTIAVEDSGGDTGGAAAEASGPTIEPIEGLLASANTADGEKVFKKCAACHTAEQGGANKVGPHLWGVVGRPIASISDFKYSTAMTEYGQGKTWTFEELNEFIYKPKDHIPGTAMGFAGLKKTEDRANLIGWLREQADSPVPLPGSGS